MTPSNPDITPAMMPVEPLRRFSRRSAWIYVTVFFLFQLVVVGAGIAVTGTPWFMLHDNYPGLRNVGYSFRAAGEHCDVLIYGDSSSLTGMNPAVIERITGLKTCNVSEGVTIQNVVGSDAPLQSYLAHNPAPRFVVTTWTPSDFRPYRPAFTAANPEGIVYAGQFDGMKMVAKTFLRKPPALPNFAAWALNGIAVDLLPGVSGKAKPLDALADRDSRHGQWPYPLPTQAKCVRGLMNPRAIRRWEDSVKTFRQKYDTPQTRVIINISPVPVCDRNYDDYAVKAEGLHDNRFERLPIDYFNEGDVHFSAAGSDYISTEAGEQVLALMKESGKAADGLHKK